MIDSPTVKTTTGGFTYLRLSATTPCAILLSSSCSSVGVSTRLMKTRRCGAGDSGLESAMNNFLTFQTLGNQVIFSNFIFFFSKIHTIILFPHLGNCASYFTASYPVSSVKRGKEQNREEGEMAQKKLGGETNRGKR